MERPDFLLKLKLRFTPTHPQNIITIIPFHILKSKVQNIKLRFFSPLLPPFSHRSYHHIWILCIFFMFHDSFSHTCTFRKTTKLRKRNICKFKVFFYCIISRKVFFSFYYPLRSHSPFPEIWALVSASKGGKVIANWDRDILSFNTTDLH